MQRSNVNTIQNTSLYDRVFSHFMEARSRLRNFSPEFKIFLLQFSTKKICMTLFLHTVVRKLQASLIYQAVFYALIFGFIKLANICRFFCKNPTYCLFAADRLNIQNLRLVLVYLPIAQWLKQLASDLHTSKRHRFDSRGGGPNM